MLQKNITMDAFVPLNIFRMRMKFKENGCFIRKVKGDKYGRNDKRNAEVF